jgi:hypothetical protein
MMIGTLRTNFWMGARSLGGSLALWGVLAVCLPQPGRAESIVDVVASSQEPWQKYKVKHGVSVDRRPVAGSHFFEYRASTSIPMAPAVLIDNMWNTVITHAGPVVKKRQVLKRSESEILFYDQIAAPVVSDRDYTLRMRKIALGNNHFRMTFETANEQGPPPDPKYVRIPAIRGQWDLEPDPSVPGGTRATYQSYSEPGGSVPTFVIHGAQVDQMVRNIEALSTRIKTEQGSQAACPPSPSGTPAAPPASAPTPTK